MIRLTSKERKALLILIIILGAAALFQWTLPHQVKSDQYDYTLQDSLFRTLAADTIPPDPVQQENPQIKPPRKRTKKQPSKTKKKLSEKSININSAGQLKLEKLPGIGPKTAQAIINYREQNGPFSKLEQLKKVKRIGPKTLQKISPYIFIIADTSQTKNKPGLLPPQ